MSKPVFDYVSLFHSCSETGEWVIVSPRPPSHASRRESIAESGGERFFICSEAGLCSEAG